MGKYSLENFEKYKTYKIRPQPLGKHPDNFGRGRAVFLNTSWAELEPERGCFNLSSIESQLEKTKNAVLMIDSSPPGWSFECVSTFYAGLIRKVGSVYDGDARLLGVAVCTLKNSQEEFDAYHVAFRETKLLNYLRNNDAISYYKNQAVEFGLILQCSSENWIECGELLARQNLQTVWESSPVLIEFPDEKPEPILDKRARFWHVALSNQNLDTGFNFSLRRLTYPKTVTNCGALPLRFWFVNTGTAPCYQKIHLNLLMSRDHLRFEIPLRAETETWNIGDIVHNEIVKLPEMPLGQYQVSVGLFYENGDPVSLDIANHKMSGFYEVGTVGVDSQPRDDLFYIWDTYYPEGYYPLEDPQAPSGS